jgi:hypothetical protein
MRSPSRLARTIRARRRQQMKPHNPDHEHALKTMGVPQHVLDDARAHGIDVGGLLSKFGPLILTIIQEIINARKGGGGGNPTP